MRRALSRAAHLLRPPMAKSASLSPAAPEDRWVAAGLGWAAPRSAAVSRDWAAAASDSPAAAACPAPGSDGPTSFMLVGHLAYFILQAADRVLHFAFGFLRGALALHLLVAQRFAGLFLDGAARLLSR